MLFHFLETEWSDIIILQNENHFAMVDTGFEEQYPRIRAYLERLGVKKLDFIILTHFHRDHYGSIPSLLNDFEVERVYLKEYSGLDCTTAWGTVADDDYRSSEMEKYRAMKKLVCERSRYIDPAEAAELAFGKYTLKLFNTGNTIREVYEDEANPDSYHKITCSENINSLGIFMEADGKNVFLGGDLMDCRSSHPRATYLVRQIAEKIGQQIDIYKAPHHATVHTGIPETLAVFRPKIVVITNGEEYVSRESDAIINYRAANPAVKLYFTKNDDVILDSDNL